MWLMFAKEMNCFYYGLQVVYVAYCMCIYYIVGHPRCVARTQIPVHYFILCNLTKLVSHDDAFRSWDLFAVFIRGTTQRHRQAGPPAQLTFCYYVRHVKTTFFLISVFVIKCLEMAFKKAPLTFSHNYIVHTLSTTWFLLKMKYIISSAA